MDEPELLKFKQMLTPEILKIAGVTGVGAGNNGLNVYLENAGEEVRKLVQAAVKAVNAELRVNFVVTGSFSASAERAR